MTEVDNLPPYCFPIDNISVNQTELLDSVKKLFERLDLDFKKVTDSLSNFAINLTHLPEVAGRKRYLWHKDNHSITQKQGVDEKEFTVHLEESKDLYLGKLIQEIYDRHNGKFQGRTQLVWLPPNFKYPFHTDYHTPNRYHVPIITNEKCFWLFKKDNDIFKLHMPADDRVWFLNPVEVEHSFVNESKESRLHLLLTSGF